MQNNREVVLVDYLRTPMSRSRLDQPERDVFHEYQADELLALVEKQPKTQIVFKGEKFLQTLSYSTSQSRDYLELHIKIVMKSLKDSTLEEAATITKQKPLVQWR